MKKKKIRMGSFILAARKKKGLTLRDVAKASKGKISNCYLSQIENHSHEVTPLKLKAIAKVLELDFMRLMKMAGYL